MSKFWKYRFRTNGHHVYCDVFITNNKEQTYMLVGKLCFNELEWKDFLLTIQTAQEADAEHITIERIGV